MELFKYFFVLYLVPSYIYRMIFRVHTHTRTHTHTHTPENAVLVLLAQIQYKIVVVAVAEKTENWLAVQKVFAIIEM